MHRLELLGRIDLRAADGSAVRGVLAQPKRLALLAYLALQETPAVRRDRLLGTFWPDVDQDRARKALNKAIHFLRQELGQETITSRSAEELAVDPAHLGCDVAEFRAALAAGDEATALELYRGELLPAFYIEGAPEFERWLEETRGALRRHAARVSHAIARRREREGQHTVAVSLARRAAELAGDDERAVRELLELLDRLGDRAGALYAYERFERRLKEELDARPASETQALVARIRAREQGDEAAALRPHAAVKSRVTKPVAPPAAAATIGADAAIPLTRRPSPFARASTRTRVAIITIAVVVLAIVVVARVNAYTSLASLGRLRSSAQKPAWVLVADFDSPVSDAALGPTLRELVSSTIDQTQTLATVPRDQVIAARQAALIPDTARLTLDHARHIAARTVVGTVVEGSAGRVGSRYSLVLRAMDVTSGKVVATVNAAASDTDVIAVTQRLARELAARIAAGRAQVAAPRDDYRAATASFAAYQLFVDALRNAEGTENDAAAAVTLRRALSADSSFATAWAVLAETYRQLDMPDSVYAAYRQAMKHADRLAPAERWALEACVARVRGDGEAALRFYDRALEANPAWVFGHVLRARMLRGLGRWDESVEEFRRARALQVLGAPQALTLEMVYTLAPLGRGTEARRLATELTGYFRRQANVTIALADADWPVVESLLTVPAKRKAQAAWLSASAQVAQGRLADGERTILSPSIDAPVLERQYALNDFRLAAGIPAVWRQEWQTPRRMDREARFVRARGFVWLGELDSARAEVARLRQMLVRDSLASSVEWGAAMRFADATIAHAEHRWRDVVSALGDVAWRGVHQQVMPQRFMVANAYEQLSMPDSALAYYDLIVSPGRAQYWQMFERGWVYPFALRRMAVISEQLGRRDRAREYWGRLAKVLARADPQFQPLAVEARARSGTQP